MRPLSPEVSPRQHKVVHFSLIVLGPSAIRAGFFLIMYMEVWKDIKGLEGKYQISSLGRVKSLLRYAKSRNGSFRIHKERILKGGMNIWGYKIFQLCRGEGKRTYILNSAHRLVAEAFIPNLENKRTVNHKDGNKLNNCVSNLEWCTYSENLQHAYDHGLKKVPKGNKHWNTKIILDTQSGVFYIGVKQAADAFCLNKYSLTKMLNGNSRNKTQLVYV